MKITEVFWKFLSDEKKEELFKILDMKVPDNYTALKIIGLPLAIANATEDEVMARLRRISLPENMTDLVWKIHDYLYNE
jgi:hypothetical protein